MASRFVRKVRTASGAVAVQVVSKTGGVVVGVEHVHDAKEFGPRAFDAHVLPHRAAKARSYVLEVEFALIAGADVAHDRHGRGARGERPARGPGAVRASDLHLAARAPDDFAIH